MAGAIAARLDEIQKRSVSRTASMASAAGRIGNSRRLRKHNVCSMGGGGATARDDAIRLGTLRRGRS